MPTVSVFFNNFQGGQTNVSRTIGGYRLELKDINFEHWLKLREQNHFQGG